MPASHPNITDEFLEILDLTYDVVQLLQGKKVSDPKLPYCQQLAAKLYMHASSIYELSQGTRVPVPKVLPSGTDFVDFSSIAVITRAALETYLNLFEVFFEGVSNDEREFRHQIWLLSGLVIREKHTPSSPTLASRVEVSRQEVNAIRKKLSFTKRFKNSSEKQKKQYLQGKKPHRNWSAVAKAAGFGDATIRLMYAYYSAYAHADGLSCIQIATANSRNQQFEFAELHMRLTIMILSKMILDYSQRFRESMNACKAKSKAYESAKMWSSIAGRLG